MKKQLDVRNLHAFFNKKEALKNINMEIPLNEVTAIIGPSGCGKSTFIRCINRMHETVKGAHITGEIKLENQNINEMDPVELRRHIGMVFQKPNPFAKLSIFDNVASSLRLNGGLSKKELEERVEQSLQRVALWDEVKDRLHTNALGLSGGQQQRLCMARTLAIEPRIILMDEPTSALDPISTLKVEDLIHELKKKYSIIIVTHNMQQAARISDKTAFFLDGNLIEFNKTNTIFTNPKHKKTEDYISGRFG
ncbi:phosphate ABC transporter ATP-binding protein PstB [Bacillus cereus]|uniref:phosphate ABC transporter ATP-binding protein PstB n=1 Tax=Bacillus cereus TaxID=1396 RepID=UPI00124CC955|nr:phosphate ABC transporter ATP-binding protein PstB [Bacillus cereus]KAB2397761.1 phosphate ABC transporter ATP-binding protein [Bacillus cereus]